MKVYVVGIFDIEGSSIRSIYKTKEGAIKKIFLIRDELIKNWKQLDKMNKKNGFDIDMYEKMITIVSNDNYEEWNKSEYMFETPFIEEYEVLD
jgi:hypothetical protein